MTLPRPADDLVTAVARLAAREALSLVREELRRIVREELLAVLGEQAGARKLSAAQVAKRCGVKTAAIAAQARRRSSALGQLAKKAHSGDWYWLEAEVEAVLGGVAR